MAGRVMMTNPESQIIPTLHPHQMKELEFLRKTRRAFLLSDVGCGKTPVLLKYAQEALDRGQTVLWITDAGLTDQLQQESKRWLPGIQPQKIGMHSHRFLFASHQLAHRRSKDLLLIKPDLVIVDEAAALGSGYKSASVQYKSLVRILHQSQRSVLATATPSATLHSLDTHALLAAGQAEGLATRRDFDRWVKYVDIDTGFSVQRTPVGIAPAGVQHLKEVLASNAVITPREQLAIRVPKLERVTVEVEISEQDLQAYLDATDDRTLKKFVKQQKASRSVPNLVDAAILSIERHMGLEHRHAVVFTEHKDLLGPLKARLRQQGTPVWEISGDVPTNARNKAVREFNDSATGVLVGTRALETGLNLQRASLLVTVIPSWSAAREEQREGRLVRQGSEHDTVLHVTIKPRVPMERNKIRRLQGKADLSAELLSSVPVTSGLREVDCA
jgi:superfamily II DNA or RNA helicase